MNIPPEPSDKNVSEAMIAILSALGGLARYLNTYIHGGKLQFWKLAAHVIVAAFAGYIFGHAALSSGLGYDMVLVGSGLGGWLGPGAVDLALDFLRKATK